MAENPKAPLLPCNGGGRHLRLGGGGGRRGANDFCACVSTHMLRGSGGMLPLENFAN